MRRVGWDDKQPVFRPIRHAWRVEVAHGRLGRSRRLAKSFENTTTSATGWLQVACIATTLRHLSRRTSPPAPNCLRSLSALVRAALIAAIPVVVVVFGQVAEMASSTSILVDRRAGSRAARTPSRTPSTRITISSTHGMLGVIVGFAEPVEGQHEQE